MIIALQYYRLKKKQSITYDSNSITYRPFSNFLLFHSTSKLSNPISFEENNFKNIFYSKDFSVKTS